MSWKHFWFYYKPGIIGTFIWIIVAIVLAFIEPYAIFVWVSFLLFLPLLWGADVG